jgi:hypothetical protein
MELRMSAKERDRIRVLEQLRSGQLKRREASECTHSGGQSIGGS